MIKFTKSYLIEEAIKFFKDLIVFTGILWNIQLQLKPWNRSALYSYSTRLCKKKKKILKKLHKKYKYKCTMNVIT